jgi:hypothetical protein
MIHVFGRTDHPEPIDALGQNDHRCVGVGTAESLCAFTAHVKALTTTFATSPASWLRRRGRAPRS